MHTRNLFILAVAALSVLLSCEKEDMGYIERVPVDISSKRAIVLRLEDEPMTKGTDIVSVPVSLYWGAVHHKQDASMEIWSSTVGAVEDDTEVPGRKVINTGKEKSDSDETTYDFYVSNFSFSLMPSSSNTIDIMTNSIDALVGFRSASGDDFENGVGITLQHIFAATGSLSFPNTDTYEFTGLTWRIKGSGEGTGTRGRYNMTTGEWVPSYSVPLTTPVTITSSSNYYVIPGVYTFTVSGTIRSKISGKTESFTVTSDVELMQGCKNNITGSLSSNFINDWENKGDIILD